jgi:hypothetical protein
MTLVAPITSLDSVRISPDGVHAAWECAAAKAEAPRDLCVGGAGGALTRIHAPDDQHPIAMSGPWLVYRGPHLFVRLLDPVTHTTRVIPRQPLQGPGDLGETMQVTSDGALVGLVVTADGPWWFRARLPDEHIAWQRAPEGVTSLRFLDPRRAVAAGPTLSTVWVTGDGGATWQPIQPRVDGVFSTKRLADHWAITCSGTQCAIEDVLVVTFGEPAGPAAHVLAPLAPCVVEPAPIVLPEWSCHVDEPRPATPRGRADDHVLDAQGTTEIARTNVLARLAVSEPDPSAYAVWSAGWEGHDALGTYRAHARGPAPTASGLPNTGSAAAYRLLRATRDGSLWDGGDPVGTYWLPAGGAPIHLADARDVLALPSGQTAVLYTTNMGDGGLQVGERVLVLDRTGKVVASRDFAYMGFVNQLGWVDGRLVLELGADAQPHLVLPVTGARDPLELPAALDDLPICTRAAAASHPVTIVRGRGHFAYSPMDRDQDREIARVVIERDGPPCIRGVELTAASAGDELYLTGSPRGDLVTSLSYDAAIQDLTCQRATATP